MPAAWSWSLATLAGNSPHSSRWLETPPFVAEGVAGKSIFILPGRTVYFCHSSQGRNSRRVEVEVDTGSTYTALPRELLQALGVQVRRTVASRLADGSEKPVQVGYANVRLEGAELITPVIFAEEGEPSLLGVITLEDALLAVDTVNNELIPVAAKRY